MRDITTACAWCAIIPCMNRTSASVTIEPAGSVTGGIPPACSCWCWAPALAPAASETAAATMRWRIDMSWRGRGRLFVLPPTFARPPLLGQPRGITRSGGDTPHTEARCLGEGAARGAAGQRRMWGRATASFGELLARGDAGIHASSSQRAVAVLPALRCPAAPREPTEPSVSPCLRVMGVSRKQWSTLEVLTARSRARCSVSW